MAAWATPAYQDEDDPYEEDAGLLNNTTNILKRRSAIRRVSSGKCGLFAKTLGLCGAFFGLGLCIAIPGPNYVTTQSWNSESQSPISTTFATKSAGYLIGAIIGGVLFDHFNRLFLFFVSLLVTSFFIVIIPYCKVMWFLHACMAVLFVSVGFFFVGGNVFLLDMYGSRTPPCMQALHFSFGLGAFVAPLLTAPSEIRLTRIQREYVGDGYDPTASNETFYTTLGATSGYNSSDPDTRLEEAVVVTLTTMSPGRSHHKPGTYDNDTEEDLDNIFKIFTNGIESYGLSKIQCTYLIIGLFILLVSLVFLGFLFHNPRDPKSKQVQESSRNLLRTQGVDDVSLKKVNRNLLILMAIFLFLNLGLEATYGQMVNAYAAHTNLHLPYAQAVFWGTFASTRFIAIFLASGFSPLSMILANFLLCTLAIMALTITTLLSSIEAKENMLWAGTILLALGLASTFPTALLWIERYIHISNSVAALFIICVKVGEMICPMIIYQLMIRVRSTMLIHCSLILHILSLLTFFLLWKLASKIGVKYLINNINGYHYQLANQVEEEDDNENEMIEMASDCSGIKPQLSTLCHSNHNHQRPSISQS